MQKARQRQLLYESPPDYPGLGEGELTDQGTPDNGEPAWEILKLLWLFEKFPTFARAMALANEEEEKMGCLRFLEFSIDS